jgi:Lon protease-like protein
MANELMEIPLFPLGLVLFPGMAQPLHVFEPRYRELTKRALDGPGMFGVTLAQPESVFQHEIPARVGSIARILDYHRLPDGRYNLLTAGARRFEIVETLRDQPYLRARVRLLAEEPGFGPVTRLASAARRLLDGYLDIVLSDSENGDKGIAIPDDPIELSYFIAVLLPCEDFVKQELLEAETGGDRLARELDLLRLETAHARAAAAEEHTTHTPKTGGDGFPPAGMRYHA